MPQILRIDTQGAKFYEILGEKNLCTLKSKYKTICVSSSDL